MQSWFLFPLSVFWRYGNMLTDKFGTTRKRIVQWYLKMKFLKIYAIVFLKSLIKVKKRGKIPKKLIENPNETKGVCVVWSEWEEPSCYAVYSPCQSMVRYCSAIEFLYLYGICVAISIRHLRGYIYVIYVAVSIRYISVVSNTGCAFSHYDL